MALAQITKPDPFAALLALKGNTMAGPGGMDQISPSVAETDPSMMLPGAESAPGSDNRDALRRLQDVFGVRSPEIQQQSKDLLAQQHELSDAYGDQNPVIKAARDQAIQDKVKIAAAPAEATAAGNLALGKQQAQSTQQLLETLGGGTPGASGSGLRPAINAKGEVTFGAAPAPPAQVAAQQHAASVGLSQLPQMRQIIDTIDKQGHLGPVAGRLANAATQSGLDGVLYSPEASRAFNDFKTQASLMKSNMAMAHGGARGGASPQLAQRFDALINMNQTPAALRGGIDAFERWLTSYAGAKTSDELDAADSALGITGGAYQDPYAPPTPEELAAGR
jgi:hypothetical protein